MPPDNVLNPVLGIDLGTTFSAIARWTGRGTEIYLNASGHPETQSAVYRDPETGEFLVGRLAYRRGLIDPDCLALGVKRKMDDASQKIKLGEHEFSPIELSSRILDRMNTDVEERFPNGLFEATGSVVTVPYYFKAHQCENTRAAAEMADIQCLGVIQEPIAASLSYAWQMVNDYPDREGEEILVVFDLGGGTFDLTLFKLTQLSDKLIFEVLATGGDDRLGGMDFDECLAGKLLEKSGLSLDDLDSEDEDKARKARKGRQKLIEQAIIAKETLSTSANTYVAVADILPGQHIDVKITRQEFEECIDRYVVEIREILRQLWVMAKLEPKDVDRVILVGGSSRIPCMKDLLCEVIGEEKVYSAGNASQCVAEGAALYAAYLDEPDVFGREIEITTRTCHALGVEVAGGRFAVVIPGNRMAPCESVHLFANPEDNVTSIDFNVYQGSQRMVKDNTMIGTVNVNGLPPRGARELEIKATFKVSDDQKLSVKVEYDGDDGTPIAVQSVFTMQ
ncbi:MAG: Hsp70 family protein [Phycisphaerae bacterium]|nr:Hsp70 family protein [Phycisphaerae bacterium]